MSSSPRIGRRALPWWLTLLGLALLASPGLYAQGAPASASAPAAGGGPPTLLAQAGEPGAAAAKGAKKKGAKKKGARKKVEAKKAGAEQAKKAGVEQAAAGKAAGTEPAEPKAAVGKAATPTGRQATKPGAAQPTRPAAVEPESVDPDEMSSELMDSATVDALGLDQPKTAQPKTVQPKSAQPAAPRATGARSGETGASTGETGASTGETRPAKEASVKRAPAASPPATAGPPPAAPSPPAPPALPPPSEPVFDSYVTTPQPPLAAPGPPVSEVVFPPQLFRLRMDHGSHVKDMELSCLQCHRTVLSSTTVEARNLPNHLPCQECHLSNKPQETDCAQCHGDAERGVPDPALVPTPRLHFSHRAHLARELGVDAASLPQVPPLLPLGERVYGQYFAGWKLPAAVASFQLPNSRCLTCHPNGEAAAVDQRVQLPTMHGECFPCHDDQRAPRRCSLCHPEAPDAPLRAGGAGFAQLGLRPRSHDRGWLVGHRDEARPRAVDCGACHARSDCLDCHEGRARPSFHPANYLLAHGLHSRDQLQQCASCHARQQCENCHRQRAVTLDAFAGPAGSIFHPAGWMTQRSARFHGIAGRRDLLSCVSCHREPDCARGGCHR